MNKFKKNKTSRPSVVLYIYICVCVSFVTLWVLGFLEVLQPVSVESGRYAYARDPLQLDRFTDASSPSSGSVPR